MTNWGLSFPGKLADPVELSDSRELVLVPVGTEYKIRGLIDEYPHVCWKFPCSTTIAQYHFDVAANCRSVVVDERQPRFVSGDAGDFPKFYATLPSFISPCEVNIQPKYLDKARANMSEQLQAVYAKDDEKWIPNLENIFNTVAMACFSGSSWHRARVIECKHEKSFPVELVDFGLVKIVDLANLRLLPRKFGRIPPLALKCRVRDVYENDLSTDKMDLFSRIIRDCDNLVRVEICSVREPYLVNLFHPTISSYNLCEIFYRRQADPAHEEAKWRKLQEHYKRENGNVSDQEDLSDLEDEENLIPQLPRYVVQLARIGRATRVFEKKLFVCHVENARLIYAKSNWQLNATQKMGDALKEKLNHMPTLPASWLCPATVCVWKAADGEPKRAYITEIRKDSVDLLLVDYGITVKNVHLKAADLRVLPDEKPLNEEPLIYMISLPTAFDYHPHHSETLILRELLPEGTQVEFAETKEKRSKRRNAVRVQISLDGHQLEDLMKHHCCEKRVDFLCREILPVSAILPRSLHDPPAIDSQFVYYLLPPACLSNSKFETATLE